METEGNEPVAVHILNVALKNKEWWFGLERGSSRRLVGIVVGFTRDETARAQSAHNGNVLELVINTVGQGAVVYVVGAAHGRLLRALYGRVELVVGCFHSVTVVYRIFFICFSIRLNSGGWVALLT